MLITGLSNQRIPTAPTVDAPRVAVCVVGQPRSAALTARTIRRHVLNVLDADAFLVSQLEDSLKQSKQSLAIEQLLGPRVRIAVHGTAQQLQPAGLVSKLEQGAAAQQLHFDHAVPPPRGGGCQPTFSPVPPVVVPHQLPTEHPRGQSCA